MSRLRRKPYRAFLAGFLILVILGLPLSGYGQNENPPPGSGQPSLSGGKCASQYVKDIFGGLCWKCLFPIRIGGKVIIDRSGMPDNIASITGNPDDYNPDGQFVCFCTPTTSEAPVGIYISFWEPYAVFEIVAKPGCFPFLFGMDLGTKLSGMLGGGYGARGKGNKKAEHGGFLHIHKYAFPILVLVNAFAESTTCMDSNIASVAVAYISEIDPLWANDALTLYIQPEALLFANVVAQTLCIGDCIATSIGYPLNLMFWCAGCWGGLYPYTGHFNKDDDVGGTSLVMAKLIAKMARWSAAGGLPRMTGKLATFLSNSASSWMEYDTSGAEAKCGGVPLPMIKKSQYRFNTLVPIPETSGSPQKCCHPLGDSPFIWGEFRKIPAVGEYQSYLGWRKRNCCLLFPWKYLEDLL